MSGLLGLSYWQDCQDCWDSWTVRTVRTVTTVMTVTTVRTVTTVTTVRTVGTLGLSGLSATPALLMHVCQTSEVGWTRGRHPGKKASFFWTLSKRGRGGGFNRNPKF